MFRVTYSEAISQEWRGRVLEMPETRTRRMYRWGTHWGILGAAWSCETRQESPASTDACIVEVCTPVTVDVLPAEMDDLWEEEYVSFPKGLEYNGLVMIRGDARTVLETAVAQGLPTPVLPLPESVSAPPYKHLTYTPKPHAKPQALRKERRCFIRD
jgi:hypothetical protein